MWEPNTRSHSTLPSSGSSTLRRKTGAVGNLYKPANMKNSTPISPDCTTPCLMWTMVAKPSQARPSRRTSLHAPAPEPVVYVLNRTPATKCTSQTLVPSPLSMTKPIATPASLYPLRAVLSLTITKLK